MAARPDFRGHTTLIFERNGPAWLILFNHTLLDAPLASERPSKPACGN
jgi:hypothetical protein